jgi:hypothetical protein
MRDQHYQPLLISDQLKSYVLLCACYYEIHLRNNNELKFALMISILHATHMRFYHDTVCLIFTLYPYNYTQKK